MGIHLLNRLHNWAMNGPTANNLYTITGFSDDVGDVADATSKTNLAVAIPELWASAIYGYFEKALVLKPLCDDYSSLVTGKGNKINIPEIPQVTGQTDKAISTAVLYQAETLTEVELDINKHKYCAKLFEDMGVIQANESLFSKYAQAMAYQLALQVDTDIMAEMDAGLGSTYRLATADNQVTMADAEAVVTLLLKANLPLNE